MTYDGRLLAGVTVLMAVVEAGSMTRAADALGLTPSGVGRAIQRLEAQIGVRLLDRTTRSLRLTDEGQRFWRRVGPLLDGIEEAALDAAGSASAYAGGCGSMSTVLLRLVLARGLAGFRRPSPTTARTYHARSCWRPRRRRLRWRCDSAVRQWEASLCASS